jgi:hypothetical protein
VKHRTGAPSRRALSRGLSVYVFSRVFVLAAGAVTVANWAVQDRVENKVPKSGHLALLDFFALWDGHWYMEIVRSGYPREIPGGVTYEIPEARAAFFPLYPRVVHVLDRLFPGGPVLVGVILNLVLGAFFVYLVGRLAKRIWNDRVAERAMILASVFPGSFVLGWAYSEAIMLVCVTAALLALLDERWLSAGLWSLLATTARPNALAVALACAVVALAAVRRTRSLRPLIAPLLAPLGYVGFMAFLRLHTGEPWAWFRVQREAWDEGTSFGLTVIQHLWEFATGPFSSPTRMLTGLSLAMMVAMIWAARRRPLPLAASAYSYAVLFLMLLPATVTARPRFLFTAFPLLISVAASFDDDDDTWWPLTVTCLSAALVAITALYGVRGAIP